MTTALNALADNHSHRGNPDSASAASNSAAASWIKWVESGGENPHPPAFLEMILETTDGYQKN